MMRALARDLVRGLAKRSVAGQRSCSSLSKEQRLVPSPYCGQCLVVMEPEAVEYLHQRRQVFQFPSRENGMNIVVDDKVLRRQMLPFIPLVGLIFATVAFGIYTFWWEHIEHPNVASRHELRKQLFEVEHPNYVTKKSAIFLESPLRRMSLNSFIAHIQQEPPPKLGVTD